MHKNNQNFIIIKSFFSWFTLISKNAFILGGSVLYFAYSTFRSIDISTLSIQYSLDFLTFYPQEIMVLAYKKYPIRNVYNYALQSLLVPHIANMCISTCVSAHVYQHMCISICVSAYVWQYIPPHKCDTYTNKTSIGKLTSDSPLLTILEMEIRNSRSINSCKFHFPTHFVLELPQVNTSWLDP